MSIKDYVSKINDRNLQRKRESGITTYALITVLFLCIYRLIEIYPLVPFRESFIKVFIIIGYSINICLGILAIYNAYQIAVSNFSPVRYVSRRYASTLLETVFQYLLTIIPFLFNLVCYIWFMHGGVYFEWYYLLVTMPLVFFIVMSIYFDIRRIRKAALYLPLEGTGKDGTDKNVFSIFVYGYGLFCILFSIFRISIEVAGFRKSEVVVFALVSYFILVLVVKLIELQRNDIYIKSLESFEYEINVRNLNDEQIRERLQERYLGFFTNDWIVYQSGQLDKLVETVRHNKDNLLVLESRLQLIDSVRYPIEYSARLKEISDYRSEMNYLVDVFFNGLLKEIQSVLDSSTIEPKHFKAISKLLDKVRKVQIEVEYRKE